jgi:hypothetical protein
MGNIGDRHTLDSLAAVVGMSPRNLARHFVQAKLSVLLERDRFDQYVRRELLEKAFLTETLDLSAAANSQRLWQTARSPLDLKSKDPSASYLPHQGATPAIDRAPLASNLVTGVPATRLTLEDSFSEVDV